MVITDLLHILIWAFVTEIIMLIIFEKDGPHIKNRISGFFRRNFHPYINTGWYILSFFIILIIISVLETTTSFIDNFLINIIGSKAILYILVLSFDTFWISNQIANLSIKNKWCWIPLLVFTISLILFVILQFV